MISYMRECYMKLNHITSSQKQRPCSNKDSYIYLQLSIGLAVSFKLTGLLTVHMPSACYIFANVRPKK